MNDDDWTELCRIHFNVDLPSWQAMCRAMVTTRDPFAVHGLDPKDFNFCNEISRRAGYTFEIREDAGKPVGIFLPN